jgi:5'(3')-deoxyribonucleotidase
MYKNSKNLKNWVVDLPLPIDIEKYSTKEIQKDIDIVFNVLLQHKLIKKVKTPNNRSLQIRDIFKYLIENYVSRSDMIIYLLNHGFKIRKNIDSSDMNVKPFCLTTVQELYETTYGYCEFMSKTNKAKFDLAKREIDQYLKEKQNDK